METESSKSSLLHSMLDALQAPFRSSRPGGDDYLITLISVARENLQIKDQLLSILRQPAFQRHSMLNTWLEDLKFAGAPRELRDAMAGLLDDEVAERALDLLNRAEP